MIINQDKYMKNLDRLRFFSEIEMVKLIDPEINKIINEFSTYIQKFIWDDLLNIVFVYNYRPGYDDFHLSLADSLILPDCLMINRFNNGRKEIRMKNRDLFVLSGNKKYYNEKSMYSISSITRLFIRMNLNFECWNDYVISLIEGKIADKNYFIQFSKDSFDEENIIVAGKRKFFLVKSKENV